MAEHPARNRIERTVSPDGTAEIVNLHADPRLAGAFNQFSAYREETAGPLRRRERAQAHVVLIFDLGPTLHFLDPATEAFTAAHRGGFVAGLHAGHVLTETSDRQSGVQVNFTLPGALRCFGPILGEMADRVVALEDLLGADGRRMVERLQETQGWAARLGLVEDMLLARFAETPAADGLAAEGLRRLTGSRGLIGIEALARDLDCSRKHLTQSIRRAFGLPPKQIARMLRFNHAAERLEAMVEPDLSAVAIDCGYADQAHMTRDFTEFSGYPPATFLRRRLPGEHGLAAE